MIGSQGFAGCGVRILKDMEDWKDIAKMVMLVLLLAR